MDEADMSQERAEKEASHLIAASRKPEGPTATGRCLFCDGDHRDAWLREAKLRGGGR